MFSNLRSLTALFESAARAPAVRPRRVNAKMVKRMLTREPAVSLRAEVKFMVDDDELVWELDSSDQKTLVFCDQ